MERTYISTTPVGELEQIVIGQAVGIFDFTVWSLGSARYQYSRLELIHRCCRIIRDAAGAVESIHLVAGGQGRPGPFLFIWTPEGFDPDRAACNGMPLDQVAVSR